MLRLLLVALLAAGSDSVLSRPEKRRNAWYVPVASAAQQVLTKAAELLNLQTPPFVYHMDQEGAKDELIDSLWSGAWLTGLSDRFVTANPALGFLLEEQRLDGADESNRWRELYGMSRWESVMRELWRARSQKWVSAQASAP